MYNFHNLRCSSTQYNTTYTRVTKSADLIGKTISGSSGVYGHTVGLGFTDGTYFYAKAVEGSICDDGPDLDMQYEQPEASEALQMGIIDQAEYDRCLAKQVEDREKYERAELDRLRAKFERAGEAGQP